MAVRTPEASVSITGDYFSAGDGPVTARTVDRLLVQRSHCLPSLSPQDRNLAPERPKKVEIFPYLPRCPLEEMGFPMQRQLISLINLINKGVDEGKSFYEAVAAAVEEPIRNVRHHANEYTRERPLLKGEVKRSDRIRNTYNNEPLHLDWQEREGATALGYLNLEKEVLLAGQGESVVQLSPPGWNGVYEDYEKAQFSYVRVKDAKIGELEQLTFVVNYSVEDCLDLLVQMGVNRADLVGADRKETIKRVAAQAVRLNPGKHQIASPKDFLNLLKAKRPSDPVIKIIERDLDRLDWGEDISILPPICEGYIQQLQEIILENANRLYDFAFQAEVSDIVEETIYKIAEYIRGSGLKNPNDIQSYFQRRELADLTGFWTSQNDNIQLGFVRSASWRDRYMKVIGLLQEISGCAGGGRRSRSVMSGNFFGVSSGSRLISPEGSNDYHLGSCIVCKQGGVWVGGCDICTSCEENMN